MRSKWVQIVSAGCFRRGPLSSAKKGRQSDPLDPSQEGSLCSDSTVFTFPSGPKKYANWLPKALEMEARCSQKPVRRGSKKNDQMEARCSQKPARGSDICSRLCGPNVIQNGPQHIFVVFVYEVFHPAWARMAFGVQM